MSACRHIKVKQQRYSVIPPVFACVSEAKELRENGLHPRETKELEEGAEPPMSSDQWYPRSGCFADVCQRKGDAGAPMRMYVNWKELEEIAGGQDRSKERRGAEGTNPDVHSF